MVSASAILKTQTCSILICKEPYCSKLELYEGDVVSRIWKLGKIPKVDIYDVGGKAYWLDEIKRQHYNVADGYVLSKQCFEDFLTYNHICLENIQKNEVFGYDNIRSKVYNGSFNSDQTNELRKAYDSLDKPIIVRSSSSIEDSEDFSCAGLFVSQNGVDTFEGFLDAIKICWISTFNKVIDEYFENEREYAISLLVQESLKGECGGVAFSVNPISNNPNEIVISKSTEGPQNVVDGIENSQELIINKSVSDYSNSMEEALCKSITSLEEMMEKPIDVEWLYLNEKIYILQVRPITTIKNNVAVIDVDDARTAYLPLANMMRVHSRWLEKKHIIRCACKTNDISIGDFYYWFRENDPEGINIKAALEESQFGSFEVHDGTGVKLLKKDEVPNYLLACIQPVLRVAESVSTEVSGFASILDDKCYVEAVIGGFKGFYSGDFEPSKYICNMEGKIISADEKVFLEKYHLQDKEWTKYAIEPQKLTLSEEELKKITHIVSRLNDQFSNVRIEWIKNEIDVYLFDVTLEKNDLSSSCGNGKTLSAGCVEGEVFVLEDSSLFNNDVKQVSIRMGHEIDEIKKNSAIQEKIVSLNLPKDAIVVCDYPNEKLIFLLEKVKGFVFERGSLLCHFAIILREHEIPAVIEPNAKSTYKNGEHIKLSDSIITKLN